MALAGGFAPPAAAASLPSFTDADSMRALRLLDGQSCAQRFAADQQAADGSAAAASPAPSPTASPSSTPSPPVPPALSRPGILFVTPSPAPGASAPPIPTPSPEPSASTGPVYLVRPTGMPSIPPAGATTPSPSPAPTAVPTLKPGYVAVVADKVVGGSKPGQPGEATGNVHIFYQDGVLVGERAHYDGEHTIVVSGHPYLINNAKDSILYAKSITFNTIADQATLVGGRGESTQGVQRGMVYYSASKMQSHSNGVTHGKAVLVTTCERVRAGYHLTGKSFELYPGDKLVIYKVLVYLGAAAIFFLPRVVIPLRRVNDERRPQFFPEVGYNSYQGYYIRTRIGFGTTAYYYGDYRLEFYSREGLGIGYDGTINKRNGKRQTRISFFQQHDNRAQSTTRNLALNDTENFGNTVRGQAAFTYNSDYGPLVDLPAQLSLNASVNHMGANESQSYTFSRTQQSGVSNNENLGFSDVRQWGTALQNTLTLSMTRSNSSYGTFVSNATGTFEDMVHWNSRAVNYQLDFNRMYTQTPFGINKEPELQIRPNAVFPHFLFPVTTQLTLGQYSEPQTPETTGRADLNGTFGPALLRVLGSDFSANFTFDQYAYGTGDLKARIQQNMTLMSAIGNHVVNNVTYQEQNYNGPAYVPFSTLDQQPTTNYHTAADVLRFFNSDYYNLSLDFSTAFNRQAAPVSYQFTTRPTRQMYLNLAGSFIPGPGNGFPQTTFQLATPLGIGGFLQFAGDIDWKARGRIENKTIYYSRIIGECYQILASYNQGSHALNVSLNILAFPSYGANFSLSTQGQIVPTSFNGYGY